MSGLPPRNQIQLGDALDRVRGLPDQSVDSIVTSPTYYRLRDYLHDGQLGMEDTVHDWVKGLRQLLRECARVLVPTGTVWLNVGDSYSTHTREGAPRKSLLLGPQRLAIALAEDGWIVRNVVLWAKTNTIPSSVRDRLSNKHEVILLLSRQPTYYFDLDSIRDPHTSRAPKPRRPAVRTDTTRPAWLGPNSDTDRGLAALHAAGRQGHPLGKNPGDVWHLGVSQFRGAHFATFPEQLARRMILAGTPRMRCGRCRAPWVQRLIRRRPDAAERHPPRPTCGCAAKPEPGLVLDPFMGSGTTAIAAAKLARDWVGVELNPDFVSMAEKRIRDALQPHRHRPARTDAA